MVVSWNEHHIPPLPSAAATLPTSVDAAGARLAACAAVVCVIDSDDGLLKPGAVFLVAAELLVAVANYVAEVPPRHLHCNAASLQARLPA